MKGPFLLDARAPAGCFDGFHHWSGGTFARADRPSPPGCSSEAFEFDHRKRKSSASGSTTATTSRGVTALWSGPGRVPRLRKEHQLVYQTVRLLLQDDFEPANFFQSQYGECRIC